jgi:DNA-directed RNA polymerase specialized sigma24 family protein
MESTHSYTRLIGLIQSGDEAAARELYNRLYDWLLGQARYRLRGTRLLLTEPEDLAARAFERFGECVQNPGVHNRHDLMRVLARVIRNAALSKTRYERLPSVRRGRGEVIVGGDEVKRAPDPSPTMTPLPAEARARLTTLGIDEDAEDWQPFNEECSRLLDTLVEDRPNQQLQEVALLAWIGYTEEEIAARLGCVLRTVERKVKLIKEIWSAELDDA